MCKRYLYLRVSHDRYELPEVVTDSVQEMARICGTTAGSVSSCISHYEHGKLKWTRYRKVAIDEAD